MRSRSDRWTFVGLLLLLVWLPLPWGSKPPAAAALFGLAVGLLTLSRLARARSGAVIPPLPAAARVMLGLWLAWLGWIALQLVPLPPDWLAVLSPLAYEHHAAAAAGAYRLSVMPGATFDGLLLSAAYALVFWLVLVCVARNRYRQRLLLQAIVLGGLAQALYGALMTLSGWEYGFFAPKVHGVGWATGTFVNRNHLAGYLELSLSAGVALILADLRPQAYHTWRDRFAAWLDLALSRRMRVRAMLVVMVVALVLTKSRMGNVAFFASLALWGGIYVFLRHQQVFIRSLVLFASLIAIDLLIVSDRYGLEQVAQRIETTDWASEQRADIFEALPDVLDQFRWTGAGLGSFAAVYAAHRPDTLKYYVDHAHNDHLEFMIEAGMIGYAILVLLAACVALHGWRVMVRRNDPAACALGFVGPMALTCLALHGLVDFNLQVPSNAATLVALLAACVSCSASRHDTRLEVHSAGADSHAAPGPADGGT